MGNAERLDSSDIRRMTELQKEVFNKDREIRRLNSAALHYEQTITNLRREMSQVNYTSPCSSTRVDVAVTADIGGDTLSPENESGTSGLQALRSQNVSLRDESFMLRRLCAALEQQWRDASQRAHFKDYIIREMRRQLKQAKTKLDEMSQELRYRRMQQLVSGDQEFSCSPPRTCRKSRGRSARTDTPRSDPSQELACPRASTAPATCSGDFNQ